MDNSIQQKPSIQLEGYPILTEINSIVYEDLLKSQSKYVDFDSVKSIITLKRSFFKRNKEMQHITRYFVEMNDGQLLVSQPKNKHLTVADSKYIDDAVSPTYKEKTIAIILEAPHMDEYVSDSKKLIPIAPAQGQIGRKIDAQLENLLNQLKMLCTGFHEKYRIVIIHPVPYQTSLHFIHRKQLNNYYRELRDKVWLKMWFEVPSVKQEFSLLLQSFNKDSILINACTKSLKPYVNEELIKVQDRFQLFETCHPSSSESWIESIYKLN